MKTRIAWVLPLFVSSTAFAGTITVGPSGKDYTTPCAAIGKANAGDVIEVDAASYDGDTCAWTTDNLTVRGVGGRAKIDLTGVTPNQQKGIFNITAPTATLENFELSGAAISQNAGNNGAGIRHLGLNLTVRNCFFHDNQDGILGAPTTNNGSTPADGQGTVLIESSEFASNGAGDGYSHNMYLNHYASFTLRYSYSHGAKVGHLVKTRAYVNFIEYNRITDETGTTASYEIDIPNGGTSYVIGNLIEQAATSQNPIIVTTGEEGTPNPDQHFYFVNNTVVNDLGSGTFLNTASGTTALIENNVFRGKGNLPTGGTTNWDDSMGDPMLANEATFDYHLKAGSPCIDKGTAPGTGQNNQSLAPDHDYVHPASTESRAISGTAIDIGAYEYGNVGAPDGGGTTTDGGGTTTDGGATNDAGSSNDSGASGDGGTNGGGGGGCSCDAAGSRAEVPWLALIGVAAMARRRKR